LDWASFVFDLVQHLRHMRTAQFVDADLTDARLDQPVECALNLTRTPEGSLLVPHVSGHKIINYAGNGLRRRGWCSVVKGVFAAVDALAQIASFSNGPECRPIRPCANCEPVFAPA
jgi:hypothetical protein